MIKRTLLIFLSAILFASLLLVGCQPTQQVTPIPKPKPAPTSPPTPTPTSTPTPLRPPSLLTPAHDSTGVSLTPVFKWRSVTGAIGYRLQLSSSADFDTTLANEPLDTMAWTYHRMLDYSTTYYWRVRTITWDTMSDWNVAVFTTIPKPLKPTSVAPRLPKLPFDDDFDDSKSGWPTDSVLAVFECGYRESEYYILIKTAPYSLFLANQVLEAHYKFDTLCADGWVEEGNEGAYGLVFGWLSKDTETRYHFLVSSNGTYMLEELREGRNNVLVDWTESDLINKGSGVNRLKLETTGNEITAFINEELVTTITIGTQQKGFVGLIAQTFDQTNVYFGFDNFHMDAANQSESS